MLQAHPLIVAGSGQGTCPRGKIRTGPSPPDSSCGCLMCLPRSCFLLKHIIPEGLWGAHRGPGDLFLPRNFPRLVVRMGCVNIQNSGMFPAHDMSSVIHIPTALTSWPILPELGSILTDTYKSLPLSQELPIIIGTGHQMLILLTLFSACDMNDLI